MDETRQSQQTSRSIGAHPVGDQGTPSWNLENISPPPPFNMTTQNSRGITQRTPYRLSERRVATARPSGVQSLGSVRMTYRQPLDTLPLELYSVYSDTQTPREHEDRPDQAYLGHYPEIGGGIARTVNVPHAHSEIPVAQQRAQVGVQVPRSPEDSESPLFSGLMTFRVEPNGNSAVVIRHSEGHFQPGEVIGSQAGLTSCFESRVCPICQEEWIWRGFTAAEIAVMDSSGAEWEVARLPCGHAFHSACLAVWFHEGSPSCPCCRKQYRFREYRWSESFCYEGWRLRYNWRGDHEENSLDAYLDGHPHYPSISRRVSFTIRSQSEEQPRAMYRADPGQASPLPSHRRRHPSWTTLSSSGGGTVLRRTRRTSRYVSDTLNALEETSMAILPEEPITNSITDFSTGDLQALAPDMIINEPEYWNRYEIEIGEEGEGSQAPLYPSMGEPANGSNQVWPHLDVYISPATRGVNFSSVEQTRSTTVVGGTLEGEEIETPNNEDPMDLNAQMHRFNTPLSGMLRQWNTQSTVGDVLRDFHIIIAYVLEGMQKYEAGMAPWPHVSPNFDQSTRNLCQEDIEENISISSASRRVLSLLESTGIPETSRRISKIPRLVRKGKVAVTADKSVMSVSEDLILDDQELFDHTVHYQNSRLTSRNVDIERTSSPKKATPATPGRRGNTPSRYTSIPINLGENKGTTPSRSPDKIGDITSKIPVLFTRPGGWHSQNANTERNGCSPVHKGVENSPIGGQREKLMAGEMQLPLDLHLMRGRTLTREFSPKTKGSVFGVTSPKKDNNFNDAERDETDDERQERKKKGRFT